MRRQVYTTRCSKNIWERSHTNIDIGLLGKDSLRNRCDGKFTQPGVPRIFGKDLIQIFLLDFMEKILFREGGVIGKGTVAPQG